MNKEFHPGEYIIYQNGDTYQIGRIKSLTEGGAFVWYHEGETAAKTPLRCMHKLENAYAIKETSLGGAAAAAQVIELHTSLFDTEEIHENCTVQVWSNSTTGDVSVGWWENAKKGTEE